ncbi:MAG: DUF4258 domain-containing protein [Nitrospirota bacterium]|jgi:hypothetical protein
MFDQIVKIMRKKIRNREYIMSIHGNEEMDEDSLSIYDVEHCILTGKIFERQKDKVTAEWKYRLNGQSLGGGKVEVVAKLSPTGKLVIITMYVS